MYHSVPAATVVIAKCGRGRRCSVAVVGQPVADIPRTDTRIPEPGLQEGPLAPDVRVHKWWSGGRPTLCVRRTREAERRGAPDVRHPGGDVVVPLRPRVGAVRYIHLFLQVVLANVGVARVPGGRSGVVRCLEQEVQRLAVQTMRRWLVPSWRIMTEQRVDRAGRCRRPGAASYIDIQM